MNSSAKQISPCHDAATCPWLFPLRQVSQGRPGNRPEPPPPRRNMPSMERVRQGGKLDIGATLVECGKPSLRLLDAIAVVGSRLHRKFSNGYSSSICFAGIEAFAGVGSRYGE